MVSTPEFPDIFRSYSPFAWRILRRLGVPERDVADVVQEVFVVVHRNLSGFEGRSSLRTWLYGICVRTASDYRKRAHVRRESPTGELPEEPEDPLQESALDLRRRRAQLDALLDELDEEKRAVIVLFEIEQLSMNEVAEAVGCPVQTAYSRLYKAREMMQSAHRRKSVRGRSE